MLPPGSHNTALRPTCRRLRVMIRFAAFCLRVANQVIEQSRLNPVRTKADIVDGYASAQKLSRIGQRLLDYVRCPHPKGQAMSPGSARREDDAEPETLPKLSPDPHPRALKDDQPHTDTRIRAPLFKNKPLSETPEDKEAAPPSPSMRLAARISAKAERMISRDQLLRFGPMVRRTSANLASTPQPDGPTNDWPTGDDPYAVPRRVAMHEAAPAMVEHGEFGTNQGPEP
ncbi:MAG: hypothetical protein AAFR29_04355 [Pseudomonadota bacterium]